MAISVGNLRELCAPLKQIAAALEACYQRPRWSDSPEYCETTKFLPTTIILIQVEQLLRSSLAYVRTISFQLNDRCWFTLTLSMSNSKINVLNQSSKCEIETLLLQTTNRKSYIWPNRIAAVQTTLSGLQNHLVIANLFKLDFSYSCTCSNWQDFDWHRASRGPSAIADFLVISRMGWDSGILCTIRTAILMVLETLLFHVIFAMESTPW